MPDWDKAAAIRHAQVNHGWKVKPDTKPGKCAQRVREAIEAGFGSSGSMPRTESAKNYGILLQSVGFQPQYMCGGYQAGDIVVIQPVKGSSAHGHMAIFDGGRWISDYGQRSDGNREGGIYPPAYATGRADYMIYRYTGQKSRPAEK